ncbi:MAG TPA: hypothetical protein DCW90_09330 [Lachnospiraceae bacterium]|nr:hypothetical protein [Lachnospiraceae bacterium]
MKRIFVFATIALILDLAFILLGLAGILKFNLIRVVFTIILTFIIAIIFLVAYLTILLKRKKNK